MIQQRMNTQIKNSVKVLVSKVCIMALLTGCSAQLRTTTVTGIDGPKMKVAELQPEQLIDETVQPQPIEEDNIRTVPALDIPVEEPARPMIRPNTESEILAASKASSDPGDNIPHSDLAPESNFSKQGEQAAVFSAQAQEPGREHISDVGIPSISIEPELPALPNLGKEGGAAEMLIEEPQIVAKAEVNSGDDAGTPKSSVEDEPIQMAKVMPQEALDREITTEDLEVMLSDVFFDYDQFAIREDAVSLLEANAKILTEKFAGQEIIIEGHCDQRGTQSYNIVLGERRAKAVQGFLKDLGIPEENLQIVSFGKEKPFCMEQTEACWQENRRGHFVVKE